MVFCFKREMGEHFNTLSTSVFSHSLLSCTIDLLSAFQLRISPFVLCFVILELDSTNVSFAMCRC